jgi:AAA ATPase domain
MDRVRVRNLRSLADTTEIELKPITLLVGANNSGKSSFLRFFPLLKQSTETRTNSGLLLNEPYVDYGLFPIALRQGADPPEITFDLGTSLFPQPSGSQRHSVVIVDGQGKVLPRFEFILHPMTFNFSISFARRTREDLYSYVRRLSITIGSPGAMDTVSLDANENGEVTSLQINDYTAKLEAEALRIRAGRGIVPVLADASEQEEEGEFVSEALSRATGFNNSFLEATRSIFHGGTKTTRRLQIFRALKLGTPDAMLDQMRKITDVGSWNQSVARWNPQSAPFQKLRNLIIGDRLAAVLKALSFTVAEFARGVTYFEPVRARVQRDYRSRDVQVKSVDPDGANVAMFLMRLAASRRNEFREWSAKNFGFSVYSKAVGDGARVALRLKETRTGAEFNIADMGFGYSQMLPLLVQIWRLSIEERGTRYYRQRTSLLRAGLNLPILGNLVAIEQPELHLHPELQARMADFFVNSIRVMKEHKGSIRFVIETHSQTIVNRLGHLIEAKEIAAEDVQLLLFERGVPGKDPMVSEVTKATFTTDGILQNWPFGFFLPAVEQLDVIEPLKSETTNE